MIGPRAQSPSKNSEKIGGSQAPKGREYSRRPRSPPRGRHAVYTVLAVSQSEVFQEICNIDLLPRLPDRPRRAGRNVDTSKYCRYHRTEGHTTDECIVLKDEIENLIRLGRLPSRFIKKDGSKRHREEKNNREQKKPRGGGADGEEKKRDRRTPPRDDKPSGIIHTFSGGIEKKWRQGST